MKFSKKTMAMIFIFLSIGYVLGMEQQKEVSTELVELRERVSTLERDKEQMREILESHTNLLKGLLKIVNQDTKEVKHVENKEPDSLRKRSKSFMNLLAKRQDDGSEASKN